MKSLSTPSGKCALVRPVPDSYDLCVRTGVEEIDVAAAKRQHKEYCNALQGLGLSLIRVETDDTLPDSCFVEDTAVTIGKKAIICNMKIKSRTREAVEVAKVLKRLKEIHYIEPPGTIDGGDVLKVEEKIFVGLSARTNLQAVRQLEKILESDNVRVVPVKIRNVLHLKSACTYLGSNCVIVSEGHFDSKVLRDCERITVPKGEEYAADCLAVNGTVLMAMGHPKTKKLLETRGFLVKELDVSEFRKGDGALTCLSIVW